MTDPDGHTTTYGYDGDGNQTSLTDAMGQVTSQTFDADNRLTAITYSDGVTPNVTYAYDAAGRRTAMVDRTGTSSYTYNTAKQLTGVTDGADNTVGCGYDGLLRAKATYSAYGRRIDTTFSKTTEFGGYFFHSSIGTYKYVERFAPPFASKAHHRVTPPAYFHYDFTLKGYLVTDSGCFDYELKSNRVHIVGDFIVDR